MIEDIEFKWKNDDMPPFAENAQAGLVFVLNHHPDPRGLLPEVATIHLQHDELASAVAGVGWSKDDKQRLIKVRYTLNVPRASSWDYYENPMRSES